MHIFRFGRSVGSGEGPESYVCAGNKRRGFRRRICEDKAESVGALGGLGGVRRPGDVVCCFLGLPRVGRVFTVVKGSMWVGEKRAPVKQKTKSKSGI